MNLYFYDGPFSTESLTIESAKFRSIIHKLQCDAEQAYDLFSSFIELFQNITQHAKKPQGQDTASSSSIALIHDHQNRYSLVAHNLMPSDEESILKEKLSLLDNLKKAKQDSTLGLYLLMKSSKKTLSYKLEKSKYPGLSKISLAVCC
jgi:hypothetical protein